MKPIISRSTDSRQPNINKDTHCRIMLLLQENSDINQGNLADKVGISLGGPSYCMKAPMEKGFIKMDEYEAPKVDIEALKAEVREDKINGLRKAA